MNSKEKRLIEENIHDIENCVRRFMKAYNIPFSEYDDYYQIACLTVCDKVDKYNGTTKFSTFVNVIVKNAFIDMYRKNKAKNIDVLYMDGCYTEDDNGNNVCLADFLATENQTENVVLNYITNEMIMEYLSMARKKCSAETTARGFNALELKMEGYSGAEIAELFGVPANSVRSWMSRAKKALLSDGELMKYINAI